MGHERVGFLPKTKKWSAIVAQLGKYVDGDEEIHHIAKETIENVRRQFEAATDDYAFVESFRFLVALAVAAKKADPTRFLNSKGYSVGNEVSALSLTIALTKAVQHNEGLPEYREIARRAAADAIAGFWRERSSIEQQSLFGKADTNAEILKAVGSGAGFCEVSRLFFSKFTERYLKYYLERAASSSIGTVDGRERFAERLKQHLGDVSKHAFESAKITQSFAAGWFNKYAKQTVPDSVQIDSFISFASAKMREELLREVRQ